MKSLFVEKSIDIKASLIIVWRVLTDKECTRYWIADFGMNGWIESGWLEGHRVEWKDDNGNVCVEGEVLAVQPDRRISFTVFDVGEQPADPVAITYELLPASNTIKLTVVQGDFGNIEEGGKYYDATSKIWDKVLPKIKTLAEKMEQLQAKGYRNVRVCPTPPKDAPRHTHDVQTVHYLLDGELTIHEGIETATYHPNDLIEIKAGTTHIASSDFGLMISGEKSDDPQKPSKSLE